MKTIKRFSLLVLLAATTSSCLSQYLWKIPLSYTFETRVVTKTPTEVFDKVDIVSYTIYPHEPFNNPIGVDYIDSHTKLSIPKLYLVVTGMYQGKGTDGVEYTLIFKKKKLIQISAEGFYLWLFVQ